MQPMTTATANALSRILLVGEPSRLGRRPEAPAIRRYRLARLRLDDRPSGADRFAHLRRTYD
jgi:hypothetical protein